MRAATATVAKESVRFRRESTRSKGKGMDSEDSAPQAPVRISPHKAEVALLLNLIGAMNAVSSRLTQAIQGDAMSPQHEERKAMIEQVSTTLNSKANRLTALTAGTARFGLTDEAFETIGRELQEVQGRIAQAVSLLLPQQPNGSAAP